MLATDVPAGTSIRGLPLPPGALPVADCVVLGVGVGGLVTGGGEELLVGGGGGDCAVGVPLAVAAGSWVLVGPVGGCANWLLGLEFAGDCVMGGNGTGFGLSSCALS